MFNQMASDKINMRMMLNPVVYNRFLVIAIMILLSSIGLNRYLNPDELYYWEWGRHLDLSYYDGPPLIAYFIRISTAVFGNNVLGIKFPTIVCATTGVLFVYQLADKLFDKKIAFLSMLLLMLSPISQIVFAITTPDSALFCFWSITLYCFYIAISKDNTKYRYLASINLGLAVISKYPGVLLGVSLFIYLVISKTYRKELKNIHWYIGSVIALLIFSPVFVWNWQHDFSGFLFQWHHGVAQVKIFHFKFMMKWLIDQAGVTNPIAFTGTLFVVARYWKNILQDEKLLFLATPVVVPISFFFYEGLFQPAQANWPACAYVSASIILAYHLLLHQKMWIYRSILISNAVIFVILHCLLFTPYTIPIIYKYGMTDSLILQINAIDRREKIILSDSYQTASLVAFFLTDHPSVYILDGGNEYQYWRESITKKILNGKTKQAIYITRENNSSAVGGFFNHSSLIKVLVSDRKCLRLAQKPPSKISIFNVWND